MIEAGLVDEVQALKDMGCTSSMVSMQGLGYKEILAYLDGVLSLDDAIYVSSGTQGILQNARLPGLRGRRM